MISCEIKYYRRDSTVSEIAKMYTIHMARIIQATIESFKGE